jgi:hypothetical protein
MNRWIFLLVIGFWFFSWKGNAAAGEPSLAEADHPQSGGVLCPPGVYITPPEDCLPLGPSQYLGQMASQGITFPIKPLPAAAPDPNLRTVHAYYARLQSQANTVYATLDDAVAKTNPIKTIAPGQLKYISYIDYTILDGGEKPDYFQLKGGGWVAVEDVSHRASAFNAFQGLVFRGTPANGFGWIIPLNPTAETKRTPGYDLDDFTGHEFAVYEVVQVYAVQTIGDVEWLRVGPEEWLDGRLVGRVAPRVIPPEGVTSTRWIEVNLFEQTLAVYDGGQMAFATLIASGIEPFWTRPGVFQIYNKIETTVMSGAFEADRSDYYYLEDVPWTMYYDEARALHAAYWRTSFGFPQSHGCVNLSPGDARWLYAWAQTGDWVYVWDPSGKTPVDESLYSAGAP